MSLILSIRIANKPLSFPSSSTKSNPKTIDSQHSPIYSWNACGRGMALHTAPPFQKAHAQPTRTSVSTHRLLHQTIHAKHSYIPRQQQPDGIIGTPIQRRRPKHHSSDPHPRKKSQDTKPNPFPPETPWYVPVTNTREGKICYSPTKRNHRPAQSFLHVPPRRPTQTSTTEASRPAPALRCSAAVLPLPPRNRLPFQRSRAAGSRGAQDPA